MRGSGVTQLFSFKGFEFDGEGRRLTKKGAVVAVRPKTLAVLEYLVRNRDRTVSKDEILGAVWSGKVVEEQAVFQSISELRALFGDSLSIRTVRGRGYQWAAATQEQPGARRRYAPWAAAAAILIGVAVFAHLQPSSHPPEIIVRDIGQALNGQTGAGAEQSGIESLIVEHLRRLGWRSHAFAGEAVSSGSLLLDTEFLPHESGVAVRYTLHAGDDAVDGEFRSPSSLGAIRDLANHIEPFVTLPSADEESLLSLDALFDTAKTNIDAGKYAAAEAYLRVIVSERPDFNAARLALTYTLLQDGRPAEALTVGLAAHGRAEASSSVQDRMNSEVLLSQIYLKLGEKRKSQRYAASALNLGTQSNDLLVVAEAQEQLGELAIADGKIDSGLQQLDAALALYRGFCPSGEQRVMRRLSDLEIGREADSPESAVL